MQTEEVKESNGQYCDSTTATDLLYVGDVSSIRLYVGRAVNEDIMGRYRPEIELFVNQILKPVGAIYNVDPGALHIFHDPSSKAEAFNRSGSIFFSLTWVWRNISVYLAKAFSTDIIYNGMHRRLHRDSSVVHSYLRTSAWHMRSVCSTMARAFADSQVFASPVGA